MPPPNDSLHAAAEDGDLDRLNRFLVGGESVDTPDPEGRTPLMYAIHGRHTDVVRHLLKWGASVDAQTRAGQTPLRLAAGCGDAEIVWLLLARGADPNQIVHPQAIPITRAQAEKQLETARRTAAHLQSVARRVLPEPLEMPQSNLEELIAVSEKPHPPYRSGFKTLMAAIQSGSLETVTILLDAGVDMTSEKIELSGHAPQPITFAIMQGTPDIVRLLVQRGADVNNADTETTLLGRAVMLGNIEMARLLLELGADPNVGKMLPLYFAVFRKQADMVTLLLSHGAKLTEQITKGVPLRFLAQDEPDLQALLERHDGTDWHRAVAAGDLAAVRARLDTDAAIDVRGEDGKAALHLVAESARCEIAQLLVDRGADMNARDKLQRTPLMLAVIKGDREMVRLLLAGGAEVNATDRLGRTALYSARPEERYAARCLLINAGARVGLVEAAFLGDRARVEALLAEGAPVDYPNEGGMTALMAAVLHNEMEIAALLHDVWGANPNARDANGETPLFYAARFFSGSDGSTEAVRRLLVWGALVNAENDEGEIALKDAITYGNYPAMTQLLEHGANPNHVGANSGTTRIKMPLLYRAVMMAWGIQDRINGVRILLAHGADPNLPQTFDGKPRQTPLVYALDSCVTREGFKNVPDNGQIEKILPVIRLLLAHGAEVNANIGSQSVLERAIRTGNREIVRLILDAGAKWEGDGIDPLMWSADYPEVTALLRRRGASEKAAEATGLVPPGFLEALAASMGDIVKDPFAKFRELMQQKRPPQRWSGAPAPKD